VLASTGVSMASVIAVTLLLLAAGGISYSMHHKNEN
jgi:hypothetical protein